MYPYDFTPKRLGLDPEEVFVVMPFDQTYDAVYDSLIEPAVSSAATTLGRPLRSYRTKGDMRTTSGWIEVLEHLNTAQVTLGVLTKQVNGNVQYELGIAHATQQIRRQVLIAEDGYVPAFDTKDLIFMRYSSADPASAVAELAERIGASVNEWRAEQEAMVRHAIARITPFEFEIVMIWASRGHFAIATTGNAPSDYETLVAQVHGNDKRFMEGVFHRHCEAIGRLQRGGLLGLSTHAIPPSVEFSYYWTDLGNQVLLKFGLIDEAERLRRYAAMPRHLRRLP